MARSEEVDPELIQSWTKEQEELRLRLRLLDELPWQQARRTAADCTAAAAADNSECSDDAWSCPHGPDHCLRLVAGADLSFVKEEPRKACASLVVVRLPDCRPVYKSCRMLQLAYPYTPGFLSFREAPPVLELLAELRRDKPELAPQVLMLDGNGVLHPRGFGLACHVGVLAGLPTVGVAKSFFHVDGLDQRRVKELAAGREPPGCREFYIRGDSGATHGCAFFSNPSVANPLYISCGHSVSLATAVWLTGLCSRYRLPEPTRLADIESREQLRQFGLNAASGRAAPAAKAGAVRKARSRGATNGQEPEGEN